MAKRERKQWGKKATGAKDLPPVSQLVKAERKATLNRSQWSMEEKLKCLEIFAETNKDIAMTATKMNRSEESVKSFVYRYMSTTTGARMKLEAGAEKLADRIVKHANVEESLEVMDRLGVLEAKRDKSGPVSSFNLIIGMPSVHAPKSVDVVPVPTQKQVEEAIEAQVTEVPGPRLVPNNG